MEIQKYRLKGRKAEDDGLQGERRRVIYSERERNSKGRRAEEKESWLSESKQRFIKPGRMKHEGHKEKG